MLKRLLLLVFMLPFGFAGDFFHQSYPFQSGKDLKIELPGGNIQVTGADVSEVTVHYDYNDSNRDLEIKVENSAEGLSIEGVRKSRKNFKLHLEVTVPRNLNLNLDSKGGNFDIQGFHGAIAGKTMGGNIIAKEFEGKVKLKTMGGNIHLSKGKMDGAVETMGGNIEIKDVEGLVDCRTMGGNINLDNYDPKIADPRQMEIATMGGNINVASAPGGIKVNTMGGAIHIGSVQGEAILETKGGAIQVDELNGSLSAKTFGGPIEVTVAGDGQASGRKIDLETKGGDIDLTMPSNFSGDFDISIEYGKKARKTPEIHSDFPVSVVQESRKVSASGMINGGKNKVKLRTMNSDVTIHKGQ